MTLLRGAFLVVVMVAFPSHVRANGDETPAPRNDGHGDPLPACVKARLGTLRFRQGGPCLAVRFSPDGKMIGSIGYDQTLRWWDLKTGKEQNQFSVMTGAYNGNNFWAFSPDGTRQVAVDGENNFRVRDTLTGKDVCRIQATNNFNLPSFSPDGKLILSSGISPNGASVMQIWDAVSGKPVRALDFPPLKEEGATFSPNVATFAPDGKVIAATGNDNKGSTFTRLFDALSGKEIDLDYDRAKGMRANSPTFSPDGKLFAVVAFERNRATNVNQVHLQLWELATGKLRHSLADLPNAGVLDLTFTPDGKTIFCLPGDRVLKAWDVESGKEKAAPEIGMSTAMNLVFAPNGKLVAVGTGEGAIHICDLDTGKSLHHLKGYFVNQNQGNVFNNIGSVIYGAPIAFAPDSKIVAACGSDNLVRTWNVADGTELRAVVSGHEGEVLSVAVSPDGQTIASAATDGRAILWDVRTGKELHRLALAVPEDRGFQMNQPIEARGPFAKAVFSPDGKRLATGVAGGTIQIWDVATGKSIRKLQASEVDITSLAFGSNGTTLASAGYDGRVFWWEISTGKQVRQLAGPTVDAEQPRNGEGFPPRVIAISPDGRFLAAIGPTEDQTFGQLQVWELATGKLRRQIKAKGNILNLNQLYADEGGNSAGVSNPIRASGMCLAFAPDSRTIAWGGGSIVRLWDLTSGKERRQFGGQDAALQGVAFLPDGKTLAAVSQDGSARLWNVATGTFLCEMRGHRGGVASLAVSPDGKTLVSGGNDTTVLLWDLEAVLKQQAAQPDAGRLQDLWQKLAAEDGEQADAAIHDLTALGQPTVAILQKHLKPVADVQEALLQQLVAALEDRSFEVRKRSSDALENFGELAVPFLHERLANNPSLEVRQRLEDLLEKAAGGVTVPERIQALRAIEVLERIGSPEAKEVLRKIAGGARAAKLTQDAQGALVRLEKQ